ncbi:hypothetical protein JS530_07300 [Bifidobacterium sp. LC6]|uniref:Uncharacterized protein n=1 Tax=Bifidobacterium colobi TaxID=2809026 RepID=A0ABS5UW21_9BIFI|nr:hypothetical protein [Bifidobacterium colobi]MBT1175305.1 hypothetical protein [Bifidobacterium colobi]
MKEGSGKRKISVVAAVVVVALIVFAMTFAVGRLLKDPTTDQGYQAVASKVAKAQSETQTNRGKTKALTKQRDELRSQVKTEKQQSEKDLQLVQQYAAEPDSSKPDLILESISPDIDPLYTELGGGIDLYYYPRFTVRNNTGHVMYGASLDYQVIGKDGGVVDGDESAYVSNVVIYPGKTVVLEDMLKDAGYSGDTIKPVKFSASVTNPKYPDSTQSVEGQYADDVKTVVIP